MTQRYTKKGFEVGRLVEKKNRHYGDSYGKSAAFLELLYPNGIQPAQYSDALALTRIFDKQMRVATSKKGLGESPYLDIAGYGILGAVNDEALRAKRRKKKR